MQYAHLPGHPPPRPEAGKYFARRPRRTASSERFRSGQMARHIQRSHPDADRFSERPVTSRRSKQEGPAKISRPRPTSTVSAPFCSTCLTGRTPFLGAHALAVIKQAGENPAPKLRTLVATGRPRPRNHLRRRCLEREPQARYRSAGDLAEDLERWLEGRPYRQRAARVCRPCASGAGQNATPKLAGSLAAALNPRHNWYHRCVSVRVCLQSFRTLSSHGIQWFVTPFEDLDALSPVSNSANSGHYVYQGAGWK